MIHRRRLRRLPLLLVLAAGLGAGTACSGSGSGGDGVASIKTAADNKSADGSGDDNDKDTKTREEALLDFARCMREHGIDMPDPDTSGGGGIVKFGASASASVAGTKIDAEMEKFEAADKACRDLLGDAGPQTMDPKQQQEMQDQALAFSRCMREHGIDMPDPNFTGEGRVTMAIGQGIDPDDPKFAEAQQACGSAFGPAGKGGKAGAGGAVSVAPGGGKGGFSITRPGSGTGGDK
jgi:hypothetical protein